MIVVGSVPGRV